MIIVQIGIRGIQAVNSSGCLFHHFVGIILGVQYNRISFVTVPPSTTDGLLHTLSPALPLRIRMMFVSVPFGELYILAIIQTLENIEFIVKVVKYDGSRMLLQ